MSLKKTSFSAAAPLSKRDLRTRFLRTRVIRSRRAFSASWTPTDQPRRLHEAFFCSSSRRHTIWTGDWSSDVCSSDLGTGTAAAILYRVVHADPVLDGVPPRLRAVIAACLAKDPAARPSLRALSGMIAGGIATTGPSAVAFWPSSVARLIGAHQARLEEQTRSRPAEGFSWAAAAHPRTTPSDPGRDRPPGPQPAGPQPPGPQP